MHSSLSLRRIVQKFYFLFIIFLLFFAHTTFAATLGLSPSQGSYKVGDVIKVRVTLSSSDQSANALSGNLKFSKDLLTLSSVSKTGSLISLWAVEPSYSNSNGTVSMEGVILSGYTGSGGTILTLSFKAKAVGSADISFNNSSVLANDGQGTNILSNSGQASFIINKATEKAAVVEVPVKTNPDPSINQSPNIKIQELKKKNETDTFSNFLITSVGKKIGSAYKIEIDDIVYPWLNPESGIFQTPILPKGNHELKVSITTVNDDMISSLDTFSIDSIMVPVITEYTTFIKEKEYIVIKGLADPSIKIVLNSNAILSDGNKIKNEEIILNSDEKGLFNYVSEKALPGTYEITAYSVTKNNFESEKTLPVKVVVSSLSVPVLSTIKDAFSTVIPLIALIVLLIIMTTWGWYKVLHYHEYSRTKLAHTKSIVNKSFDILDDDINEQIKILKKLKALEPLTVDERTFVNQFKKDIESAEKVIEDVIK